MGEAAEDILAATEESRNASSILISATGLSCPLFCILYDYSFHMAKHDLLIITEVQNMQIGREDRFFCFVLIIIGTA